MIKLKCEQCGKIYKTKPYMEHKSKHHFCSMKCYGLWQQIHKKGFMSQKKKVVCKTCNKIFEKSPSAIKKNNFCSMDCFRKWQKLSGLWAGKNNSQWRGGHSQYRGKNWRAQKQEVLKRDKFQCQICGSKKNLIVHHKIPYHLCKTYKEANKLINLITLCKRCHGLLEIEFNKSTPLFHDGRKIPHLIPESKICEKCGKEFIPSTAKVKWCNDCRTYTCLNCGKQFLNKKYRNIKYCSLECRNKYVHIHGFK